MKIIFVLFSLIIIKSSWILAQEKKSTQKFKSEKIGNQTWMSENLNVSTFRNGESIPEAKTEVDWEQARINKTPVWSYYRFDPKNGLKYGKLYNWYAVNDSRGLAPIGWHIPSDDEWKILTELLGGKGVAGKKMKSKTGWYKNGNGTNESNFNALPAGLHVHGKFGYVGYYGGWWSSSQHLDNNAWLRSVVYDGSGYNREDDDFDVGLSVRCLKD